MDRKNTNRTILILFLLITFYGLWLLLNDNSSNDQSGTREIIGTFQATQGKVEYKEGSYSQWTKAVSRKSVANASTVFTHGGAKADLDIEGVGLTINENSLVRILRPKNDKTVDMSFGSLIFDSKKKESIILRINNQEMVLNLDNSRVKIVQEKDTKKIQVVSLRGSAELQHGEQRHQVDQQQALNLSLQEVPNLPVKREKFKLLSPQNNQSYYIGKKAAPVSVVGSQKVRKVVFKNKDNEQFYEFDNAEVKSQMEVMVPPGNYEITAYGEGEGNSESIGLNIHPKKELNLEYEKKSIHINSNQVSPQVVFRRNLTEGTQIYARRTSDPQWTPVFGDEWRPTDPGSYEFVLVQEAQENYEAESDRVIVQINEDDFKYIPEKKIAPVVEKSPPTPLAMEPPEPPRKPASMSPQSVMQIVDHTVRKHKISFGTRFLKQSMNFNSNLGSANYQSAMASAFSFRYEYQVTDNISAYGSLDYNPLNITINYTNPGVVSQQNYNRKTLEVGVNYSLSRSFEVIAGVQASMNKIIYPGSTSIILLTNDTLKFVGGGRYNYFINNDNSVSLKGVVAPVGMFLSKSSQMSNVKMGLQYQVGVEHNYIWRPNVTFSTGVNYWSEQYSYDYLDSQHPESNITNLLTNYDFGVKLNYLF